MSKVLICLIGLLIGFQAQAQGNIASKFVTGQIAVTHSKRDGLADAYRSKNFNMIDENNQAIGGNDKLFFKLKSFKTLGGMIGDKVEKGAAVEVNCVSPKSKYKWGKLVGTKMNGKVESIKSKGLYDFVKVKGCDYFVQSHHVIQKLQTELPAKTQSKAIASKANR